MIEAEEKKHIVCGHTVYRNCVVQKGRAEEFWLEDREVGYSVHESRAVPVFREPVNQARGCYLEEGKAKGKSKEDYAK